MQTQLSTQVITTPGHELATTDTMHVLRDLSHEYVTGNGFTEYHKELTKATRKAHRDDLRTFATYLATFALAAHTNRPDLARGKTTPAADDLFSHVDAWTGVSYGVVAMFLDWMKEQGFALATMNRKLATVRVYCNKAAELGKIPQSEAAAIRGVKVPSGNRACNLDDSRKENGTPTRIGLKKVEPIFVGAGTMRQLRDNHDDTIIGRRNRVILSLFVDFGLRVSEVAGLTVGDIDIEANTLHVYRLKTRLDQVLEMTPDVRSAILAHMPDIAPFGAKDDTPLIHGAHKGGVLTHKGITTRSIARIVHQVGRENGVERLSPHDLRHSWTDLYMDRVQELPRGKDSIRQAGGWKTSAMVDRYAKNKEIANEGMVPLLG